MARRQRARDWGLLFRHGPWLAVVAAAWVSLAAMDHAVPGTAFCFSATTPPLDRARSALSLFAQAPDLSAHWMMWAAMVLAMMPPLLLPIVRYVEVRSFPETRVRLVVVLGAAYASVWIGAFGAVVIGLVLFRAWVPNLADLTLVMFLTAAAWQVSPCKTWALRRCHRVAPLRVGGLAADRSCAALGLRNGTFCLMACLPMMVAAFVAPAHLIAMAIVGGIAVFERYADRARPLCLAGLLVGTGLILTLVFPYAERGLGGA